MLQSVLPYKEVFAKLKLQNPRRTFDVPEDDDWKFAEIVCDKLKRFYKVTEVFSGRKYLTANLFFVKVCEIKTALTKWLSSKDETISDMAMKMKEKFDKY